MTDTALGRRETKKRADMQRILASATELFDTKSYEDVTTAELAEHAGVSTGTLFRHIKTKADLLIMVMEDALDEPATERPEATDVDSAVAAIASILTPFVNLALKHPNNTLALQREVIYGESTSSHRFVEYVQNLHAGISDVVRELHANGGLPADGIDLGALAYSLYSSLYMDFLRVATGHYPMSELPQRMAHSVRFHLETPARV